MTKISMTLILGPFGDEAGVKWNGLVPFHLAPGGALCGATVPTQQDRLAFVLWVSTFSPENRQYLPWLWGHVWMGTAVGKTTGNGNGEGKSDGAGARCFAIPLVIKCHNRALYCSAAGVSILHKGARAVLFCFLLAHLQVCFFDLRLGCICLLFSPWAASMPTSMRNKDSQETAWQFARLVRCLLLGPHLFHAN